MTIGSTLFQSNPSSLTNSELFASRSWSGGDMPKGWRKNKIPLVEHDYVMERAKHSQSSSIIIHPFTGKPVGNAFIYFPTQSGFTAVPPAEAGLDLRVQSKLATAVRGSDFNLGVSLAELPESLRLVASSVSNVCQALIASKQGRWSDVVRFLSRTPSGRRAVLNKQTKKKYLDRLDRHDIDGCWNALTYGWMPALQDIEEAMKAFAAVTEPANTLCYTARSFVGRTGTVPNIYNDFLLTQDAKWTLKYNLTLRERLTTVRKLQLPAVASVVWELLPYSFVLDWFVPISSYLSTYSTFAGFESPSLTIIRTAQIHTYNAGRARVTNAAYPPGLPHGGHFDGLFFRYDRKVNATLKVELPSVNAWSRIFSKHHAANASALISARIRTTRYQIGIP